MLLSSLIISNCEDRVLFMLIHLTGVSCPLFKFFSSYQVLHLFSTGVLSEFDIPCSLFISFQPEWFQFLLVHCAHHSQLCNLQGSHGVPCFSFLPVCFHIPFDPLSSCSIFFNLQRFSQCSLFLFDNGVFSTLFIFVAFLLSFVQPRKVLWFHSFVKEATQFTSSLSLPFSLRCHSRSRDEILSQWWSVVTPRDRCARCPPVIRCCCLVIACVSCIAYHVIMCISFAYVFVSCIRAFSPLSVLHSGAPFSSGGHFYLSFVCGD